MRRWLVGAAWTWACAGTAHAQGIADPFNGFGAELLRPQPGAARRASLGAGAGIGLSEGRRGDDVDLAFVARYAPGRLDAGAGVAFWIEPGDALRWAALELRLWLTPDLAVQAYGGVVGGGAAAPGPGPIAGPPPGDGDDHDFAAGAGVPVVLGRGPVRVRALHDLVSRVFADEPRDTFALHGGLVLLGPLRLSADAGYRMPDFSTDGATTPVWLGLALQGGGLTLGASWSWPDAGESEARSLALYVQGGI